MSKKRNQLLCEALEDNSKNTVTLLMKKRGKYLSEKLNEFEKNSIWVSDEREKLRKKYPNTYVAVRGRKIIASDKAVSPLITKIKQLKNNEDIIIDFIGEQKIKLLL